MPPPIFQILPQLSGDTRRAMAAEVEGGGASFLERLLRAASSGGRSDFFPIVVGVMGAADEREDGEAAADRIVLVNPVTQGMVVLRGDAALVAELLSGRSGGLGGPPPASKASIEAMSTVELGEGEEEGEEEECAVCLDALREAAAGRLREMPCRHRFHGVCIEKWLGIHGSCPVCRYRMPAEEPGEPAKGSTASAGEAEEESGRRRGREIWVTIAFPGRRSDSDQRQQQEQQAEE